MAETGRTLCPLLCPVSRRSRSIIISSHSSRLYLGGCYSILVMLMRHEQRYNGLDEDGRATLPRFCARWDTFSSVPAAANIPVTKTIAKSVLVK